jgi:hypothetical protein
MLAVSFRTSLHRLMLACYYTYSTNTGLHWFRGCYTHPHRARNTVLELAYPCFELSPSELYCTRCDVFTAYDPG